MGKKPVVSAAVPEKVKEQLDEFAEAEGISRSEAVQRLLEQGMDVSRSDVTVIYGGDEKIVTDGSGIANQIEAVESEVDGLEKVVARNQAANTGLIGLGLIWLAVVRSFNLEGLTVALTGLPIGGLLIYQVIRSFKVVE